MNINTLDLNLLRAFRALMHEGSITAAGMKLGLTQPAMSRAIQRLRNAFDDPLFVRSKHGMQPTDYARRLAVPIEDALKAVQSAVDLRAVFDPAKSTRTFRIVTTDSGLPFYFSRLLPALKGSAPGINFVAMQMPRDRYGEALEQGTTELALGQVPRDLGTLHGEHLFDETLACLVRKGHPVIGESLTMEQFMAVEHICVTAPARADELIRHALGKRVSRRRVALELPSYLATPIILAECDMISVMPRMLCETLAERWPLRVLPLPFKIPPIRIGQMWHERSHQDAAHRWLRSTIARLFTRHS